MSYQDWEPSVIRAKPQSKSQQVKLAQKGGEVESVKKYNAGKNQQKPSNINAKKIEENEDEIEIKKVNLSLSQRLQQARQQKGWTQKELAVQIQEKPQVVQSYEAGTATPNQSIISKMEKALGVKLRGKQ
jgi:putative transcription factor